MNALRYILSVILLAAVCVLGYYLYKAVEEPITFETARVERDAATVVKLKKIRDSQIAFKLLHGTYAPNFDTLITVIKSDSFSVVKQIGDPNDSTKVVKTEVIRKALLDSLFKGDVTQVDELPIVPFTDKKERFKLEAKMITKNEVEIPAFEASTPYETLYNGLIKKYYQQKWGESMRVGSISEGTTSGNWE